ncbi:adenosylcobalamin-dependent ribonucleoside-diphosphate reductase [Methanomassiliicoccus luminyensis]|uniref:adenosylcobalamin-dependent ribonucleoside-diphosphate reductase n=1 Tax=Methanomassiliicoccus luminyensis TaxID=1080712 RepID=UPI00036E1E78|nr:adenosylcobalamin-dependent ribonucleoside-diphosphate reductase [Methanomassiliicoccus luminyensis]
MNSPPISANALQVLEKRYLIKGEDGKVIETPDQMFRRVARNVAAVNDHYHDRKRAEEEEKFYRAMRDLEFLPNSPTLMNAGTDLQQLSACFVVPIDDSIESIYTAVKQAALIHQTGGGAGFSFSRLRPAGDAVKSTGGIASGPVSFMKVFDAATEAIKQGGRRRGANMGILRVDHPDVERFISAKEESGALTNFNISVAVTDEFMEKAGKGEDYDLVNPRTDKVSRTVSAPYILERMATSAWNTGDPGAIFIDAVNRSNPTPGLGDIEATNPCGEVPLLPFEACNLGSINLDRMFGDDSAELDMDKLARTVDLGVRFLDNVIDANRFPLEETRAVVLGNRKIGLGVMGFADMLARMRVRYGSKRSLEIAENLIVFIKDKAEKASGDIARSRGDFPNISKSIFKGPRRNATVLSIAPTGTISMIASCSSGIEPYYAIAYTKNVLGGQRLMEVNPHFVSAAVKGGFYSEELMRKLTTSLSVQGLDEVPKEAKDAFVTAHDIEVEEQVDVQAVFQKHVDNAVSKTINLPESSSWKDVLRAYQYAHSKKCKGITVYREGSRQGQVLTALGSISLCPHCGQPMRAEEGAMQCESCG